MGNRISVSGLWRPDGAFDGVGSFPDTVPRLAGKTVAWLGVSAGAAAMVQWLRGQRWLGRAFPRTSAVAVQDALLSTAHASLATFAGLKALL